MNNSSGESRAGDKGGKRDSPRENERQERGRGDEEIDGGRARVIEGEDVKLAVETKGRTGGLG